MTFVLVVVCVLLTLIYYRLFRRNENKKSGTTAKRMAIIAIAVAVIWLVADHHFTPSKWKADPRVRHKLTVSLQLQYRFVGKTRQEITDILGEGSETNIFKRSSFPAGTVLAYYIGQDGVDSRWMIFHFDEAGNCTDVIYDIS
ncbi:MAG: hypothetical protein II794_04005 [Oscillospiraceae bacterium]|nr:hypothetical protein [Oscillospiraceae bacterium]